MKKNTCLIKQKRIFDDSYRVLTKSVHFTMVSEVRCAIFIELSPKNNVDEFFFIGLSTKNQLNFKIQPCNTLFSFVFRRFKAKGTLVLVIGKPAATKFE